MKGQNENEFVVFLNLDYKWKLVGTHLLEKQKNIVNKNLFIERLLLLVRVNVNHFNEI